MSSERVLCVDDDPNILEAIRRTLGSTITLETAPGGEEGLKRLREGGPYAVVVSDLRMPVVDGVSLLRQAHELSPTTVRILLTGHADVQDAISAVNDGRIFRLLTKPCPASQLRAAITAGLEQYRLITAERVLLGQTLRGSIRALTEIVALVHPSVGARTSRVRRLVVAIAEQLGSVDVWEAEVTALLSHVGDVTLPAALIDKRHSGAPLTAPEQEMVANLPQMAIRLVANLPRLDAVQSALVHQNTRWDGGGSAILGVAGEGIPAAARILKLARDYDDLEFRGATAAQAIATLTERTGAYEPRALEALARIHGERAKSSNERILRLSDLTAGMVFAEDILAEDGVLLIARGQEVHESLLARIDEHWNATQKSRLARVWVASDPEGFSQAA